MNCRLLVSFVIVGLVAHQVSAQGGGSCAGCCDCGYMNGCYCDDYCQDNNDCCSDYSANCVVVDPCSSAPCLNGGACAQGQGTSYYCTCPSGYSGQNCEEIVSTCQGRCGGRGIGGCWCDSSCRNLGDCCEDYNAYCQLDGCLSSPCQNGGTCINNAGSYSCECLYGFSGFNCEDFDACSSAPCLNGGVCTDGEGSSYDCSCMNGYYGDFCQHVNWCSSSPCLNGGTCNNTGSYYTCFCQVGFSGQNCESTQVIGTCQGRCGGPGQGDCYCDSVCQNLGDCCEDYNRYCLSGNDTNPCDSGPCLNGGACYDGYNNSFVCFCPSGFYGAYCQYYHGNDTNPCDSGPCLNGGACYEGYNNSFWCSCPSGYYGEYCQYHNGNDTNPCYSGPCLNGGSCYEEYDNSFWCYCPSGYYGQYCQYHDGNDTNPCDSGPCLNGGVCYEDYNNSFVCSCPSGYYGEFCQYYNGNFCASAPCMNGGSCFNNTCVCPSGYYGNTCQYEIDACMSSPCQNGGTCHSYAGSFYCSCPLYFSGVYCEYYM
ncbi:fibropellin-1-like [Lytechinus variegatus]|uniref:fibropellin-1-like n=1 Tax=Lytechinus variegatus TaxID=7654 RepID=UPI001BB18306|nr:fibropellin-1-like [Lytechinus variegatus]